MAPIVCTVKLVEFLMAVIFLLSLVHLMGLMQFVSIHRIVDQSTPQAEKNDTCRNSLNSTALSHQDSCCKVNSLLAVILVTSSPSNFLQRTAIRNTWGAVARRDDIVLVFLLGQTESGTLQGKILQEDAIFGDIVQGQFLDSYQNLTLKCIEMLRWVNAHCVNAEYMVKIDDDVFLNAANFLRFIQKDRGSRVEPRAAIFGRLARGFLPERNKQSKWYISEQEYAPSSYPDFIHGPSYVYTKEAVPLIYTAAIQLMKARAVIHLEDVFLNGICAKKANVTLVDRRNISVMDLNDVCTARESISFHDISAEKMYFLWWLIYDANFEQCPMLRSATDSLFSRILRGKAKSLMDRAKF